MDGEGAERRIVSYVTFKVDDPIKGDPGANYTLRMLGGTVDGETMEVSDSPKFKVGDRDILFVENNGSQFIPLVGIMHGRFHVQKDDATGREVVTTNERQPLRDVAKLGRDEHAPLTASAKIGGKSNRAAVAKRLQSKSKAGSSNQPASQ